MQHYLVVQIRRQIYTICLLRTTTSFIKDHPVFFVGKRSNFTTKWDLWRNWTTLSRKRTTNCWSLLMSGWKSVSRHKEASEGGGSFAPQGGLIAQHNLAICINRTTCLAISTNLSSGWFYQDHRWSLGKGSIKKTRLCIHIFLISVFPPPLIHVGGFYNHIIKY